MRGIPCIIILFFQITLCYAQNTSKTNTILDYFDTILGKPIYGLSELGLNKLSLKDSLLLRQYNVSLEIEKPKILTESSISKSFVGLNEDKLMMCFYFITDETEEKLKQLFGPPTTLATLPYIGKSSSSMLIWDKGDLTISFNENDGVSLLMIFKGSPIHLFRIYSERP
jgi:hypothetical protein